MVFELSLFPIVYQPKPKLGKEVSLASSLKSAFFLLGEAKS